MHSNYTPEYQTKVQKAWKSFTNNDKADYSFIRPEILESWNRSRAAGVTSNSSGAPLLSSHQLTIRINSNMQLLEIVRPYMEKLYSIVQGSGFYLLFCDKDGYILDLIGDKNIIEHGKSESLLVVGANRREEYAGTNAIGTCLFLKKPIQIWGAEHYLQSHKGYVCSGAPIIDDSGNLLGCLNITGLAENVHPHTLGLIVSAVDGITKEMNIKKAYSDIELISAQRNSIIQSMTSGLILLNSMGRIIQVNDVALKMLDLEYGNIIGKNLFDFISLNENGSRDNDISFIEREMYNKEVTIHKTGSDNPPRRYNMSVNFVKDSMDRTGGTVIRLNETKVINELVNTINGFNAKYTFQSIIGESDAVKKLVSDCKHAAESNSTVLLLGKSGTGKELLAQSIHNDSHYAGGPFVPVNCAAIPRSLIESELFGYEKGSFTGANKSGNPGKFELADGGTIFLDEIGDMPLDAQTALLRVIQTREVIRIGGKYAKPINVRIIAATNRNLLNAIEQHTFREDLYYRLNVFSINVPSLIERSGDIRLLTDHFVNIYGSGKFTVDPQVYEILDRYPWPGNIRQLENVIERAINIADSNCITADDLSDEIKRMAADTEGYDATTQNAAKSSHNSNFSSYEKKQQLILESLKNCGGNVSKAAVELGISRRTLYRKMEKYKINSNDFRKV